MIVCHLLFLEADTDRATAARTAHLPAVPPVGAKLTILDHVDAPQTEEAITGAWRVGTVTWHAAVAISLTFGVTITLRPMLDA